MLREKSTQVLAAACLVAGLGAPCAAQQQPATSGDAILVLDASGSMWGQIDGVNKIVIAKEVVENLIRGLPQERRVGLVAYGHRKKGDCGDIETLADVGADRNALIDKVRSLSPVGKTPLSKSIEHAALELQYKKNAATVILVSDGLETCDVDPCALARTLEENGLDLTVHVIGFDVTEEERKGLVCIAAETGGEFLAADNADELTDALQQVADPRPNDQAAAGAAPNPVEVALKATLLRNGPDIQSMLSWTVTTAAGGEALFSRQNAGYVSTSLPPGDYVAEAVWSGWPHKDQRTGGDKTGRKKFTVVAARPSIITVPIDLGIPVSLESAGEIFEGEPVAVRWSGPDDLGAYITVNAPDDGPREQIYFSPAQKARDAYAAVAAKAGDSADIDSNADGRFDQDDIAAVSIGGPSIAGEYEVRYVLSDPRLILARKPLIVKDGMFSVSAPREVVAAESFDVSWAGRRTPGDFVTIIEKDSAKAFSNGRTAVLQDGQAAKLTAFAEPGEYEIRYVLANGYTTYEGMQHAVQASTPITVRDVSVSLAAPATAVGGSTLTVRIELPGDNWQDDQLSIVPVGANRTNADARQGLGRIRQADGSFQIRVPAAEGSYEIAYFLEPGARVVARRPLAVSRAQATVDAPDRVKAGETFEISYSGDGFNGDRVLVMPADTPDNKMWSWGSNYGFVAKAGEQSGTVNGAYAAKVPGEYEARYVTGLQHLVLARDKFTVVD